MTLTSIDNGNGGNLSAIEQQLAFLGTIQVFKFSAGPAEVQPFGSTNLSWQRRSCCKKTQQEVATSVILTLRNACDTPSDITP